MWSMFRTSQFWHPPGKRLSRAGVAECSLRKLQSAQRSAASEPCGEKRDARGGGERRGGAAGDGARKTNLDRRSAYKKSHSAIASMSAYCLPEPSGFDDSGAKALGLVAAGLEAPSVSVHGQRLVVWTSTLGIRSRSFSD